jgi:hypothetical protein
MVDHILLTGLPERQPIHGKRVPESLHAIELSAQREGEDVALDLGAVLDRVDPVRDELAYQRVPRRSPVLQIRPAASNSRSTRVPGRDPR